MYTGESKPSVVFLCNKNVRKWGLAWKDVAGSLAIIIPLLTMDTRIHSTIGLSTFELHGINNKTVVLAVEERLPKSDRSITYRLILDLSKISLELCTSRTKKGYLFFPEDRALWTPKDIQEQWDQVDKARSDSVPIVPALVHTNIEPIPPKKRATKWKSVVETTGTLSLRTYCA